MRTAITGAFGYSGKYIAKRLLAGGHEVLTLTNSVQRANPFGSQVQVHPFNFDRPELLTKSLQGVEVLINTYWVRFDHKLFTHEQAVANTRTLFDAARKADVRRVVHVSITNPDPHSDLPYFKGKVELEQSLLASGLSYCILRPTVLFGKEDVLINNIAWALRRLPMFGVYGKGDYRLQPIYVDDLAAAAAEKAAETKNEIVEAIGPETFTYRGLVRMIAQKLAPAAGNHRRSAFSWLLDLPADWVAGARCRGDGRRDSRVDGEPPFRGRTAPWQNEIERMGGETQSRSGTPVHERNAKATGSNLRLQVELSRQRRLIFISLFAHCHWSCRFTNTNCAKGTASSAAASSP